MSAAANIFSQADVTLSEQEDGEVRVNIGNVIDGSGLGAGVAAWGVDGFVGMPNLPSDGQCCVALVLEDGNQQRCIGFKDNRFASKAGELQPGDRAIVSDCDARLLLKKEDNCISLYTVNEEAEEADGTAQMLDIRGSTGVTVLLNSGCIIQQTKDEILIAFNGGSVFKQTAEGFEFFGQKFSINCSTVTIGLMPGGLPPTPGTNGAIYGVSGVAGVASTSVTIAS